MHHEQCAVARPALGLPAAGAEVCVDVGAGAGVPGHVRIPCTAS